MPCGRVEMGEIASGTLNPLSFLRTPANEIIPGSLARPAPLDQPLGNEPLREGPGDRTSPKICLLAPE
eukprot:6182116-Pyramimonas_sp.AAC.1